MDVQRRRVVRRVCALIGGVAAAVGLLGCGSGKTDEPPGNYVCFEMATDDWGRLGTFQQRFIVGNKNLPGMTGFHVIVNDESAISITLEQDVDPNAWIDTLPSEILDDPALGSVEATTKDCVS